MLIPEMHVWFRQYAQQMGMQNVRAILPEQIDLLINTSITDIVNQLVKENISATNDRVITDNSKIGQINAFRTLYRVAELDMTYGVNSAHDVFRLFTLETEDVEIGKLTTNSKNVDSNINANKVFPDNLFIVDFSLNYKKCNKGYALLKNNQATDSSYGGTAFDSNARVTNYFPVRMIDDVYLSDTLNDFVLQPRLRSPIIVTYNNDTFDLYIEPFKYDEATKTYTLQNKLVPYKLRVSYIAKPAKVRYAQDIQGENVDCDLPEYMHVDILKHAVDLWRTAVSGSLYSAQQQEQAAQQENVRNNYRNEGTQQRQ